MLHYWQREIENLKKLILSLGAIVEEQIQRSMLSLDRRDTELADEVIARDREVDSLEILIEEECLKILALYQPVAKELRFVIAVLKMNNDLERMGDLASNIAKRVRYLSKKEKIDLISEFRDVSDKVQVMVKKSLDALVNTDVALAREVLAADDEVDRLTKQMLKRTINAIEKDSARTKEYFSIRSISKNLERIADSATNIAEDVVYLCSGEIIRHQSEDFNPEDNADRV
ncbi:MAG TPA: phosphate signaling complex protein PhoU [Ignavibacteria bacterium]|nr:phosphate signaling complex protein PhoU [Ignavibacteria bacterium]HRE11081.1 phosphate signaling complex protein PhoU [Ignavibacteria bacterium]HRF64930.1 phosphate signaling complex protein PhoU [Ignavibacteria bacterium]HRJ05327.1 phosphate signaling complex protein PhoU [Ignavibacteria bacterium]